MTKLIEVLARRLSVKGPKKDFEDRRRQQAIFPKTYRDYPSKDGTSRYDDVWGA